METWSEVARRKPLLLSPRFVAAAHSSMQWTALVLVQEQWTALLAGPLLPPRATPYQNAEYSSVSGSMHRGETRSKKGTITTERISHCTLLVLTVSSNNGTMGVRKWLSVLTAALSCLWFACICWVHYHYFYGTETALSALLFDSPTELGANNDWTIRGSKSKRYPDGIEDGVLSRKPNSFFRQYQTKVDSYDPSDRCRRYGFTYNGSRPLKKRRIFYGSLIADEPWETVEIVSTEARGVFAGAVFVESNRTQNLTPRPFRRLRHGRTLQKLFDSEQVQVRTYVNDDM